MNPDHREQPQTPKSAAAAMITKAENIVERIELDRSGVAPFTPEDSDRLMEDIEFCVTSNKNASFTPEQLAKFNGLIDQINEMLPGEPGDEGQSA